MKKLLLIAALLLGLNATPAPLKADCFYVGGFAGANWIQSNVHHFDFSYKTGYMLGGNFGYRWSCTGFRIEGEYSYRKNRITQIRFNGFHLGVHGHQRYYAGMGNLYYDFCVPDSYVTPFVGAGVGWYDQRINIERNTFSAEGTESKVAWQLLAGLTYEVNACYSIVLSYRMLKPAEKFFNHGATLGANYNF